MDTSATDVVDVGFRPWTRAPLAMARAHVHPEVEANFVPAGRCEYLLAGKPVTIPSGRLVLFWGAIPHRLVRVSRIARMHWLTVPLADLLALRLPAAFVGALFAGEAIVASDQACAGIDALQLERWSSDWERGSAWRDQVRAEIGQRLRRLALDWAGDVGRGSDERHAPVLVRAARRIAETYREDVQVSDLARDVGVHPKYLAAVFRRACGIGVHDYLTRLRLAEAQHLLRSTDRRVLDIAFASGFRSANAFYAAFARHVGMTPQECREAVGGTHG